MRPHLIPIIMLDKLQVCVHHSFGLKFSHYCSGDYKYSNLSRQKEKNNTDYLLFADPW